VAAACSRRLRGRIGGGAGVRAGTRLGVPAQAEQLGAPGHQRVAGAGRQAARRRRRRQRIALPRRRLRRGRRGLDAADGAPHERRQLQRPHVAQVAPACARARAVGARPRTAESGGRRSGGAPQLPPTTYMWPPSSATACSYRGGGRRAPSMCGATHASAAAAASSACASPGGGGAASGSASAGGGAAAAASLRAHQSGCARRARSRERACTATAAAGPAASRARLGERAWTSSSSSLTYRRMASTDDMSPSCTQDCHLADSTTFHARACLPCTGRPSPAGAARTAPGASRPGSPGLKRAAQAAGVRRARAWRWATPVCAARRRRSGLDRGDRIGLGRAPHSGGAPTGGRVDDVVDGCVEALREGQQARHAAPSSDPRAAAGAAGTQR